MNKRNELEAYTIEGSVDSDVVIHFFNAFCRTLQGPTVVVVDNASIHTSEAFQGAIPQWEKQGLWIFYLPAYSPELNLIAHVQGGSVAERQFFSLSIKRSISIETEDNLSPETEPY